VKLAGKPYHAAATVDVYSSFGSIPSENIDKFLVMNASQMKK
jgi:hypothetical protein